MGAVGGQAHVFEPLVVRVTQDGFDEETAGSWDPQVGHWGDSGGRVYSTAINAMSLMVPWRQSVLK